MTNRINENKTLHAHIFEHTGIGFKIILLNLDPKHDWDKWFKNNPSAIDSVKSLIKSNFTDRYN